MEYRCVLVGDVVVEPYALLRRLLYDPFDPEEEAALQRDSLLDLRTREAQRLRTEPIVSAPPPHDPARWTLTMSNPSMPSVDITIRFGVVTDPQLLPQLLLPNQRLPQRVGVGDVNSSESASAAGGLAFHQPHCIVAAYNPFSLRSFQRMRAEWSHFLDFARDRAGDAARGAGGEASNTRSGSNSHSAFSHAGEGSRFERERSSDSRMMRPSSTRSLLMSVDSPLSPAVGLRRQTSSVYSSFPADGGASVAPTVLLVASRLELLRQAIEATPSVEAPTPTDVSEIAQRLQARAYVEVDNSLEDRVDELRLAIARACVGDLTDAPVVGYDVTVAEHQDSVDRAMEAIHNDNEEEDEETVSPTKTIGSTSDPPTPGLDGSPLGGRASSSMQMDASGGKERPRRSKSAWTYRRNPKTGRAFFVNRLSRVSQYDRPEEYDGKEPSVSHTEVRGSSFPNADSTMDGSGEVVTPLAPQGSTIPKEEAQWSANASTDDAVGTHAEDVPRTPSVTREDPAESSLTPSEVAARRCLPPPLPLSAPPLTEKPRASSVTSAASSTSSSATSASSAAESVRAAESARRGSPEASNSSLVGRADIDYGSGDWDADHILAQMREARCRKRAAALREMEQSVEELKARRKELVQKESANTALAEQLRELREEVTQKEKAFTARVAAEDEALDKEIERLSLATLAAADHHPVTHGNDGYASPENELEGPAPSSEELLSQAAGLQDAEADLNTLLERVKECEAEFHTLREAAMAGQREQQVLSARLATLLSQGAALDTEEAGVRRELRMVSERTLATQDSVQSVRALLSSTRRKRRVETEAVLAQERDADDCTRALTELRRRVEVQKAELNAERQQCGTMTLSVGEERQRLQLLVKSTAAAVALDALQASQHRYLSLRLANDLCLSSSRLQSVREAEETVLRSEQRDVEQLFGVAEDVNGAAARMDAARMEALVEHLEQLAATRDGFADAEARDFSHLYRRCAEATEEIADVFAFTPDALEGGSAEAHAQSCWAWTKAFMERTARAAPQQEDQKNIQEVLHAALRDTVFSGPFVEKASTALLRHLQAALTTPVAAETAAV